MLFEHKVILKGKDFFFSYVDKRWEVNILSNFNFPGNNLQIHAGTKETVSIKGRLILSRRTGHNLKGVWGVLFSTTFFHQILKFSSLGIQK